MALGPIPRGTAVATGAGRLPARYVIHGAVMGQDLTTDAGLVRETTRACLALADELGCASLALPAFGTGVGGFPLEECARIMVAEARGLRGRDAAARDLRGLRDGGAGRVRAGRVRLRRLWRTVPGTGVPNGVTLP